ncbi:MAG: hypothetical protein WAV07_17895 [Candidatus Contendobacter sp.]
MVIFLEDEKSFLGDETVVANLDARTISFLCSILAYWPDAMVLTGEDILLCGSVLGSLLKQGDKV